MIQRDDATYALSRVEMLRAQSPVQVFVASMQADPSRDDGTPAPSASIAMIR